MYNKKINNLNRATILWGHMKLLTLLLTVTFFGISQERKEIRKIALSIIAQPIFEDPKVLMQYGLENNCLPAIKKAIREDKIRIGGLTFNGGAIDSSFKSIVSGKVRYRTPLLYAIENKDINLLKYLLKKGAKINWSVEKKFPLIKAISWHYATDPEITNLLIACRADVNVSGSFGDTPLIKALEGGYDQLIAHLLDLGAKVNTQGAITPLEVAIIKSDKKNFNKLIKHGADVNLSDSQERTPLRIAIKLGEIEFVKSLLEKGAKTTGYYSYACKKEQRQIARLILEHETKQLQNKK